MASLATGGSGGYIIYICCVTYDNYNAAYCGAVAAIVSAIASALYCAARQGTAVWVRTGQRVAQWSRYLQASCLCFIPAYRGRASGPEARRPAKQEPAAPLHLWDKAGRTVDTTTLSARVIELQRRRRQTNELTSKLTKTALRTL